MANRSRKSIPRHVQGWEIPDLFAVDGNAETPRPSPTIHFSRNVHADAPDTVEGVRAPLPLHIFLQGGGSLHLALSAKRGATDLRVWDSDCEVLGACSQEGMRGYMIKALPRPLLLPVLEAEWEMRRLQDHNQVLLRCKNPDSTMDINLQPADPAWSIQFPKNWGKAPPKLLFQAMASQLVHAAAAWSGARLEIAAWNESGSYFYRPTGHGRPLEMQWQMISPLGLARASGIRIVGEGASRDGLFWKGDGWFMRVPFEKEGLSLCPLEDALWPGRDSVALLHGAPASTLPIPHGSLYDARVCLTGRDTTLRMEIMVEGAVRLEAVRRTAAPIPVSFTRWMPYRMIYPLWGYMPLSLSVTPATLIFHHDAEGVVIRATST